MMPNISEWLMDLGISEDLMLVLTFTPILITMTTISRYITGIKTFGIYSPLILAFSYYFMGARQAIIITILVILSSGVIRNLFKKVRLHYLSRLSIVYGGNVLVILSFIALTSFIPSDNPIFDFRNIQPIPLIMIISITDRFMANYIKKDLVTTLRLTGETLVISILGWLVMRFETVREFFINNLIFVIPLSLVVNYAVGKYSGLRWTELIRFNQVIKNVEKTE